MRIVTDISQLKPAELKGSVVTVGNFDGVHLGHQLILKQLVQAASQKALPGVVITFNPHPRHFFAMQNATKTATSNANAVKIPTPQDLTPLEYKLDLLATLNIDLALVLSFDQKLAEQSATEFTQQILLDILHAKFIVAGYDCCFGKKREGNAALLKQIAASQKPEQAFSVLEIPPLLMQNAPVSSSRIRESVNNGRLEEAAGLLGRLYCLNGLVATGKQRGGSLLGYPTANLATSGYVLPQKGIYATVTEYAGAYYSSVTNIGFNPSFGDTGLTVETHILNFNTDIYSQHIRVYFVQKLRDEKKFNSLDELKAQIGKDAEAAKALLTHLPILLPSLP